MKSKILIIGGTGYIEKRLVKASLEQGHDTYVLYRLEIGVDVEKIQMLLSFKKQGAHLVTGSFNDHCSLVEAVKKVDIVICAISGEHILSQLKLVDAIKEAGNVKRFLPSEFGTDPSRMVDAMEPGRVSFVFVAIFVDEDDIATYTIKTIEDFRTLNKTFYITLPSNILSQRELVELWEKLIGKQLLKPSLTEEEFLGSIKDESNFVLLVNAFLFY